MSRRYKQKTGIGTIAFVVLIFCAIVSYKRIGLSQIKEEEQLLINRREAQIQEQQERSDEITKQKAYVQTKRYIEEMAREKLGLVYEDEIIFQSEEE